MSKDFFSPKSFRWLLRTSKRKKVAKLLVHAQHGILGAGTEHRSKTVTSLPPHSLVQAKAEHLRELVSGEAEQSEAAGALEEFVDGENCVGR